MGKIKLYVVEEYASMSALYRKEISKSNEIELLDIFDNAEDCIDTMLKEKADIVLINLKLPYMNGIEATKIIAEEFPKTKIIVTTSRNNREELLASLSSGANGYILKSTNLEMLSDIIKAVYIGAIWVNPQILNVTKSFFPKPDSTDINNLYKKGGIKTKLTARECEVLNLVAYGKSNVEIGKIMMVSTNTAKAHVGNILSKLDVKDRVQAAVLAAKEGFI